MTEKLEEHPSLYSTVKNWVALVKRGAFSTCDAPRPGRLKIVTTPEIIRQIHEIIMEERHISAKCIIEQLGISREQVGSITNEDLDTMELSAKWVPKCPNAGHKFQRCHSSEQSLEFFGSIQMISSCDWLSWTKPGYIAMTRWESNNQWSDGIAVQLAPNNSVRKNPMEIFSP